MTKTLLYITNLDTEAALVALDMPANYFFEFNGYFYQTLEQAFNAVHVFYVDEVENSNWTPVLFWDEGCPIITVDNELVEGEPKPYAEFCCYENFVDGGIWEPLEGRLAFTVSNADTNEDINSSYPNEINIHEFKKED